MDFLSALLVIEIKYNNFCGLTVEGGTFLNLLRKRKRHFEISKFIYYLSVNEDIESKRALAIQARAHTGYLKDSNY